MNIDKNHITGSDNIKENVHKNTSIIIYIFLVIELVLYISFLYFDFSKNNSEISSIIKYISIFICLLFVLFPVKKLNLAHTTIYDSRDIFILRFALIFTFASDYFLLFTNEIIAGLITFIIVQLLYLIRIFNWKLDAGLINRSKQPLYLYFFRNILIVIFVLIPIYILLSKPSQDTMLIVGLVAFYFISLLINLIDSIKIYSKTSSVRAKIFAIGLLFFVLCDINVGLFNIAYFIPINTFTYIKIYNISSIAMWLFYLPSQVLISLSKNLLQSKV